MRKPRYCPGFRSFPVALCSSRSRSFVLSHRDEVYLPSDGAFTLSSRLVLSVLSSICRCGSGSNEEEMRDEEVEQGFALSFQI
jgi:hypothetical protein